MPLDATTIIGNAFADLIGASGRGTLVIGLSGAQGSGKSTIADALDRQFRDQGLRAAKMSLDDFYLTKTERRRLAREVHPLFETRGAPGTHDIARALQALDAIRAGEPTRTPSFDKGADDRRPPIEDKILPASLDVVIFEGWCLGATPAPDADFAVAINALEQSRDPDRRWRRAVNAALAGDYQTLFARIDKLVFLRAPSFDAVHGWRLQQERALARKNADAPALMDADEIGVFIQHYERITRSMLRTLPACADLTVNLDDERRVIDFTKR
ncbi:MAG: hypothetical protein KDE05_01600 [Parvularculaceae bacterium]|nr:hypothetical protein [Parvularculaceae bacterium]